jgi:hypothetical protein
MAVMRISARPAWFPRSSRASPCGRGVVRVFDLTGRPLASTTYARSSPIGGSDRCRFYAMLGVPPINAAAAAVRAAIVAEHRTERRSV